MQNAVQRHRLSGSQFPVHDVSSRRLSKVRRGDQVSDLQKRPANHEGRLLDGVDLIAKSGLDSPLEQLLEFVHRQRVKESDVAGVESRRIGLRRPVDDRFARQVEDDVGFGLRFRVRRSGGDERP